MTANMLRDRMLRLAVVDPGSPLNGSRPEDVAVSDGTMFRTDEPARAVNANMADYLVPVNADVPVLDARFLVTEDTMADPIGVNGLGEVVIVDDPLPCSTKRNP